MSKLTKKLINFTIQETNIIFFNKEIKNYQQAISINKLLWIQKHIKNNKKSNNTTKIWLKIPQNIIIIKNRNIRNKKISLMLNIKIKNYN